MRALAALWLACAALAMFCPARADALSAVRERGELVWGGDLQGGEPYVFEDPRDPTRIVGFEVDIAAAIARELGLRRARFFQVQWSNLVPSLERGDFDVALNGLEDTPERRARLPRLASVLHLPRGPRGPSRVALSNAGRSPRKARRDVEPDVRLRAPPGSPGRDGALRGTGGAVLRPAAGRASTPCFSTTSSRSATAARSPGIDCLPTPVRGGYVVGMRRDDAALARAVDEAVSRLIASGELRRILEAWHLWDDAQEGLASQRPIETSPPAVRGVARSIATRWRCSSRARW